MAVARRTKPDIEDSITLSDGLVVNVTVNKSNLTQGDRENNADVLDTIVLSSERLGKLKQRAIDAPSDDEYQRHKKEYKKFQKQMTQLVKDADRFILTILKKWDMCLTEEDEKNGITVPLTLQGLSQLEDTMRLDVFMKLFELLTKDSEEEEAEKKDSSANSNGDIQTPTESPALFLASTQG